MCPFPRSVQPSSRALESFLQGGAARLSKEDRHSIMGQREVGWREPRPEIVHGAISSVGQKAKATEEEKEEQELDISGQCTQPALFFRA